MKEFPIVLSIAGSDPSGGAGIQADIKAISACGGYAAAAVTAVTVQNTQGVSSVEYLSGDVVAAQVDAVMSDLAVDAVKIGMTGTVPIVEAIASQLEEASKLAGFRIRSLEDMDRAAVFLRDRYDCAFLVKGGDLPAAVTDSSTALGSAEEESEKTKGRAALSMIVSESTDVLCDMDGLVHITSKRVLTNNLHGTGCTLSSAIATFLGAGYPLRDAVQSAVVYVHNAIEAAASLRIGHGHGPLRHFYNV